MSLPSIEKMLGEVQGFVTNPTLLISAEEAEAVPDVPEVWVEMLRQQQQGIKSWVEPWQAYQDLLPDVYYFLQHQVQGICLLLEEQCSPSLLYVYSREENDYYFHRGRLMLDSIIPESKKGVWEKLPPKLQNFYAHLYDGWTELSSNAIGPLPIKDIEFLSDQDWDIEARDKGKLPFQLNEVVTVFNNGAGDLIGLDVRQGVAEAEAHALVWWHEEPLHPDVNLDFWALMNAWISSQVEDVDLAQ